MATIPGLPGTFGPLVSKEPAYSFNGVSYDAGGNPWTGPGTYAQNGQVDTLGATNTATPATADPMAAEKSSFLTALPGSISNINNNATAGINEAYSGQQSSAEELYNQVNQGQKAINTSRENIELNRLNGVKDILGFVRNGLRSGGTRLANMNAGESSAVGEIGRVYNQIGSDRSRGVGNEAFLQNRDVNTKQDELNLTKSTGETKFHRQRDTVVNSIGQQVRDQLAKLESEGSKLGITGKVAVDQEKQRVIDEGMKKLSGVDEWLKGMLGGVNPQDSATTRTNAIGLQQGGQAAVTPFDFGNFAGQQLQGAPIDQLPIVTGRKKVNA